MLKNTEYSIRDPHNFNRRFKHVHVCVRPHNTYKNGFFPKLAHRSRIVKFQLDCNLPQILSGTMICTISVSFIIIAEIYQTG